MDDAQKQLLIDDPALFIVTYFQHRITKLEEFHLRLIRTATQQTRSLILYPAGHGKTTLVSTLLPIWALCKDPNIRIVIIGKNDDEVQGIMQVIQAELTDNQELIRDFGPFKPSEDDRNKPWALGRLSVAKRTRRAKEPTITVFGSGAKTVLGYRTDWTICDDVITERNSSTPEQRQKIRNWFDLCVETGPEHDHSRLTVVGTRFDPNDLYADLEEMEHEHLKLWAIQREDAVAETCVCGAPMRNHPTSRCNEPLANPEAHKTLWPERWPWKRLMIQKAKVGTLNFNKRYRNIAVDASRMVFKEEHVRGGWIGNDQYPGCLDRNYRVGDYDESWRRCAGFDPAIGATRSAKFCAHLTLAQGSCRDHERCYWVMDVERDQLSLPQQVDMVLRKHDEYRLQWSIVEGNSAFAGWLDAIKLKQEELGIAYAVEGHFTTQDEQAGSGDGGAVDGAVV
jgi:hypothetical protein